MDRRGFLGALTAGLASLGLIPKKKEQPEEKLYPAVDHLYASAGLGDRILSPVTPEAWRTGDVWLDMNTRETFQVHAVFDEGTVQVLRGISSVPSSIIEADDVLMVIGSHGKEYS